MSDPRKVLMLGLKGSGKTTFLAALWHHLESAENPGRLQLEQLQPDRIYLNGIRNAWLALNPVPRTSSRTNVTVSIPLRDNLSGLSVELSVPDLSGEIYRMQWAKRTTPAFYAERAKDTASAFLFVHPVDIRRTYALKTNNEIAVPDSNEVRIKPNATWTPEQTSTQVQLVELVQLLMHLRSISSPLRLAVIVSAWDLIKAKISPDGWLEGRLPLLSQFLVANQDRVISEVFGVSAQGGDLESDRTQLLNFSSPSRRATSVRGNTLEKGDVVQPLEFLLDLGGSMRQRDN